MFSLPFISCFSHLDSEIPSVFLSVLVPAHRRNYSSHAEKHTKSSNLSSLPLLFCHTRLNCISSAAQPHLRWVQLQRCRRERSIPAPRTRHHTQLLQNQDEKWHVQVASFGFYVKVNHEKSLLKCSRFFLLTRSRPRGQRSQQNCWDQPSLASMERLPRELRRPDRWLNQGASQSAPHSGVSWRSRRNEATRPTSSLKSTDRILKSSNFLQPDCLGMLDRKYEENQRWTKVTMVFSWRGFPLMCDELLVYCFHSLVLLLGKGGGAVTRGTDRMQL